MLRRTKIVCTLGPATDDPNVLRQLMESGMNVARLNFSHQEHDSHKQRFQAVVRMREEFGFPVATLLDTKGPEVRLGTFAQKEVELKEGQSFTLHTTPHPGDQDGVSITHTGICNDVKIGSRVLIDDGLIAMRVVEKGKGTVTCRVENGGKVSNQKGVNLPDSHLSLPFVSDKDRDDIAFGVKLGFDFIATSFTRTAQDIKDVRAILKNCGGSKIKLIAKIENRQGVENIEEILAEADGIMVARGDMGVEIPFEELPAIQKMLIKKAYQLGKPVITATQMLESMMQLPRPTRAEASDVANAIYDETSAVMLSGETAAGKYPVEACKTIALIAEQTEKNIHYKKRFAFREFVENKDMTSDNITKAISKATVNTAHTLEANAILTVTKSGATAREISKFYPEMPIVAGAMCPRVCRQMNLLWGIYPVLMREMKTADELFDHVIDAAKYHNFINVGDLVVLTAGLPIGNKCMTNTLKAQVVGEQLFNEA